MSQGAVVLLSIQPDRLSAGTMRDGGQEGGWQRPIPSGHGDKRARLDLASRISAWDARNWDALMRTSWGRKDQHARQPPYDKREQAESKNGKASYMYDRVSRSTLGASACSRRMPPGQDGVGHDGSAGAA
ncbi:hypothetical protein HYQ46_010346 [Verticillium longisporum]|nr:hypothetical protein HYQ46_010346 [Verticillium longisporum]